MEYNYISINNIFSGLIRKGVTDFSEDDVIEWCGEALEFIGAVTAYEQAVAFIEIKDHQGKLPSGLHQIIQVARNNRFTNYKDCTPLSICEELANDNTYCMSKEDAALITPSYDGVWLDASGTPIVAYDMAYYRPYFDLRTEVFGGFGDTPFYKKNFTPVRLANHSFFGTVVMAENKGLYHNCTDEYTIIQGTTIRTSFKEGQVAVSHYRQVRDNEGYPMIPDQISYRTAITKYLQYQMADREFQNGRDGAEKRLSKYESDWHWYCKQAGNFSMMPKGIDEFQNLLDQRTTLIPNFNKYYNFFGNQSRPEGGYPIRTANCGSRADVDSIMPLFKSDNMKCSPCGSNSIQVGKPTGLPDYNRGKQPVITTVFGNTLTIITDIITKYRWTDVTFKGYRVEVFVNSYNRYLDPTEYTVLADGGVDIIVGGPYDATTTFKMIPNGLIKN